MKNLAPLGDVTLLDLQGRWLVVHSIDGCAPCDALVEALRASGLADRVRLSKLRKGDTATRSEHLRQGVRAYPTTLFVENGRVVSRIEGRTTLDGQIDLSDFTSFLDV